MKMKDTYLNDDSTSVGPNFTELKYSGVQDLGFWRMRVLCQST